MGIVIPEIMDRLLEIIREAGEIILDAAEVGTRISVDEKSGTSNFVTQYDLKVQNYLIDSIKKIAPEATFIAEEKENDTQLLNEPECIIIDPIDGTANFINNYHHSCISLAIVSHGVTLFGAVYDPYMKEMFHAVIGHGAYLNGEKISVGKRPIERAIVAFGTSPYHKDTLTDKTFSLARELFLKANDVRRCGSAALDLAYLAAGRNDIFAELILQPWDQAAGAILVKEAGGIVCTMSGEPLPLDKPSSIMATSRELYSEVFEIVSKYV